MSAEELLAWLSSLPPNARDAALEAFLGIGAPAPSSAPPGAELIGYHASGVAPIVRMLVDVPVSTDDVFVDLGAGLGKVVLLTRLLAGARARGIEIDAGLVERARSAAAALGVDVHFNVADVRDAELDDGTVFFLYAPFTGSALTAVLGRLRAIAERHAIVVCALGVDLGRAREWLVPRPTDAFWLTLYDSVVPGVSARAFTSTRVDKRLADHLAFERDAVRSPSR